MTQPRPRRPPLRIACRYCLSRPSPRSGRVCQPPPPPAACVPAWRCEPMHPRAGWDPDSSYSGPHRRTRESPADRELGWPRQQRSGSSKAPCPLFSPLPGAVRHELQPCQRPGRQRPSHSGTRRTLPQMHRLADRQEQSSWNRQPLSGNGFLIPPGVDSRGRFECFPRLSSGSRFCFGKKLLSHMASVRSPGFGSWSIIQKMLRPQFKAQE